MNTFHSSLIQVIIGGCSWICEKLRANKNRLRFSRDTILSLITSIIQHKHLFLVFVRGSCTCRESPPFSLIPTLYAHLIQSSQAKTWTDGNWLINMPIPAQLHLCLVNVILYLPVELNGIINQSSNQDTVYRSHVRKGR